MRTCTWCDAQATWWVVWLAYKAAQRDPACKGHAILWASHPSTVGRCRVYEQAPLEGRGNGRYL